MAKAPQDPAGSLEVSGRLASGPHVLKGLVPWKTRYEQSSGALRPLGRHPYQAECTLGALQLYNEPACEVRPSITKRLS